VPSLGGCLPQTGASPSGGWAPRNYLLPSPRCMNGWVGRQTLLVLHARKCIPFRQCLQVGIRAGVLRVTALQNRTGRYLFCLEIPCGLCFGLEVRQAPNLQAGGGYDGLFHCAFPAFCSLLMGYILHYAYGDHFLIHSTILIIPFVLHFHFSFLPTFHFVADDLRAPA